MASRLSQEEIITKLGLRGTLLEQLVLKPEFLSNPERYMDTPSLMRFAVDVRRALATEGWSTVEAKTSRSR